MASWDVIVVGGGPSGLSTALHLAARDPSWAARTLVIERARYPRHKLCGGGITRYGVAVLERLGLDLGELPQVPIEEMMITRGRQFLRLDRGFGLRVVRRDAFDAWLAGKLLARGVAVHQGELVTEVERDDGGVRVVTDQGAYEAKALVVADGSTGALRRKLGLEEPGHVARAMEILTPADASDPVFREARAIFDFSPTFAGLQGYYWDFPCVVDGRPHVNRGVFDARIAAERPRAELRAILADCLRQRGLELERYELEGHPIRWINLDGRLSLPRVLLVGDAAGADPLLGEGIAFALAYGEHAAASVAQAFERGDFRFLDYGVRVAKSEHGRILRDRVAQARQVYRDHEPRLIQIFEGWLDA